MPAIKSYMPVMDYKTQVSSNLPTNMYDTPSIAMHQAIRGKIGKTVEALLKPENMTPADMRGITNRFLADGKNLDPVTRTLIDVSTNPLMWIGMLMWIGPYWKAGTGKLLHKSGGVKSMLKFLNNPDNHTGLKGLFTSPSSSLRSLQGKKIAVYDPNSGTKSIKYFDQILTSIGVNTNIGRQRSMIIQDNFVHSLKKFTAGKKLDKVDDALVSLYVEKKLTPTGTVGPISRVLEYIAKHSPTRSLKGKELGMEELIKIMNKKNPTLINVAEATVKTNNQLNNLLFSAAKYKTASGKIKYDERIVSNILGKLHNMGIVAHMPGTTSPKNVNIKSFMPRIMQNPIVLDDAGNLIVRNVTPSSYNRIIQNSTNRVRSIPDLSIQTPIMDVESIKALESVGVFPEGTHSSLSEVGNIKSAKFVKDMEKAASKYFGAHYKLPPEKKAIYDSLITKESEMGSRLVDAQVKGDFKLATKLERQMTAMDNSIRKLLGIQDDVNSALKELGYSDASAAKARERKTLTSLIRGFFDESFAQAQGNSDTALKIARPYLEGMGKQLSLPYTYNMNPNKNIELFSRAIQPMYGTMKDNNIKFLKAIIEGPDSRVRSADPMAFKVMKEEIIPMLEGKMHPKEIARREKWREKLFHLHKFMGSKKVDKIFNSLGPMGKNMKNKVLTNLRDPESVLSKGGFSDAATGYLSLSTLGGNLGAAHKNSMQVPTTVGPITGGKALFQGITDVVKRAVKYNMAYARAIKKHPEANREILKSKIFSHVFPEFHSAFGPQQITDALVGGDITKEGQVALKMARGGWYKFKKALMTPFGFSEKFNRLWSFYSFRNASINAGHTLQQAQRVAVFGTQQTQFTGGVWGQPDMIRGTRPMLRQYMHFPLRFVEYLKWGTGLTDTGKGVTLQPLGKLLAGSTVAYEAGKNLLDIDISPGLMFQAMPFPTYEQSPFYPFPLVPPALAVVGQGWKALRGDPNSVGSMASLLTPGGVAGRRAMKALSPKLADYEHRTADGKIPVYNKNDKLLSYQTPGQLIKRAIGVHSYQVEQELQAVKYLTAQRDKIRDYRKKYIKAMLENDYSKMNKINAQHRKDYPEIGDVQIKKSDIKNYRKHMDLTRFQRVMKQIPRDYRDIFNEALTHSSAIELSRMENNPQMLQREYQRMNEVNSPYPLTMMGL